MKKYTVRITETALKDMEEIYRYIAGTLCAPDTAADQYDRIAEAALSLELFPERNRVVAFEPEQTAGLRRQLVDNYSVFYVVREEQVIVTNVLYSASDIEARLNEK